MPDTSSTVEILLRVRAEALEQLTAVKTQLAGLTAEVDVNKTASIGQAAATTAAATATGQWSPQVMAAAQAGAAWNAQTNAVAAAQLGLGGIVGKTAANFAPATAAQRAASVATAGAAVNSASLARNLDLMAAGMTRAIPGTGALASEISLLGRGAIGTAASVGVLNTVLIGAGIAGALAFAVALGAIVTKGIEVQKTLQDLGQGVQATLGTDSNFTKKQIDAAGPASMDQIVNSARDAKVPIDDLSKAFSQVFPAAARAGTEIKTLSDVVAKLISQEDALHIPQAKLITDLEAIFNGSVRNTNQLAQELGVTKEQALQARENGSSMELLTSKVEEFAKAHEGAATTISRAQQEVKASFDQLALAAVKPIIQPLTDALIELSKTMDGVDASNVIAQLQRIIDTAGAVISACQAIGRAIVSALQSAAGFASGVGNILKKSAATVPLGETEGSTGGGPTAEENQNAADVASLSAQETLAAQSRKEAEQEVTLEKVTVEGTGTRPPIGGFPGGKGGGGGGKKGPSQDSLDQKEISDIMSQINEKQTAYNALVEKNDVNHKLGLTTLGQEDAANLKAGTDYGKTIDAGIAKLEAMKQKIIEIGSSQGGLNDTEDKQVNKLQQAIDKLTLMQSKLALMNSSNTFGGQFTQGLQKFSDTLQLTGTKAANFFTQSITTGIDSTSQALTGLIFQTKNWQQAFTQAAESIVQSFIKIALQAVIGAAISKSVSSGTRLDDARTAATGAYQSASQIPYIGWIIGPIAAAAAFAACLAFAGGGIVPGSASNSDNRVAMVASGEGIITTAAVQHYGPETIHAMNAMTFERGGIVPFNVAYAPSFASGGIVGGSNFGGQGGGGTASRDLHVNVFPNQHEMVQHVLGHPDAEHKIVDIMKKNRFQIKI